MTYEKKPDYRRFHSFYCWRGFGLLRFPEELPNRLHYEGLHEFLDSHGNSRRAYNVSRHHHCIDWFNQENVDLARNAFPSANNLLKRLGSLASGLLYDFNCGETCWTV